MYSEEWKEGQDYEDVMDEDAVFESWIEEDWEILHGVVLDGLFCESCWRVWERLGAPLED